MMTNSPNAEKELRPWSYHQKKLVITTRLKFEADFKAGKRKKSSLWSVVWEEIKKVDPEFPFTKDEIYRKFSNMCITYKRIKERNSESGREATRWEFFELFDTVYGTKHSVNPPKDQLIATLEGDSDIEAESGEEQAPETVQNSAKKSRKGRDQEILHFLEKEATEEERRHQEMIRVETQRIEVLQGIKELLERMLQQ